MKKEVGEYFSKFLDYQQVKVKHEHTAGVLNPLPILDWKWEIISLDFFITVLPRSKREHDSIMVVVYTLIKEAHFIQVQSTYGTSRATNIFMKEILRLHGVPKMIVSNRDSKFTSNFQKPFFGGMGTKLNFSMTYILKRMEKLKEPIKFQKTCFECMLWTSLENGKIIYIELSLLAATFITHL